MGAYKNIQMRTVQLCDLPFQRQVEVWKDVLNDITEEDIQHYHNTLRGNLKVSFNVALGELDE